MSDNGSEEHGSPHSGDASRTGVATETDFQEALRALVLEADSNGVDVRGSWPVIDDRAWDVEITSLSRRATVDVRDSTVRPLHNSE